MGSTPHGIKYPELSNLPNVPDDIGGIQKLDQTAQAWLAQIDSTNLGELSTQNSAVAAQEAAVSSSNTNITPSFTRQSGQQASVNAIQARNDSITSRLDARDATLTADQTTIQGFGGQVANLPSIKGRGFLGATSVHATQISGNNWSPVASLTFNDPAPNANRIYRAFAQVLLSDTSGTHFIFETTIGLFWAVGTSFTAANPIAQCSQPIDYYGVSNTSSWIDSFFTGMSASQWTLWLAAYPTNGIPQYQVGQIGDFITLEDVGLQL